MSMEPEVSVKKLETMVKLDAVRRGGASSMLAGHTQAQVASWRARQACPESAALTCLSV